MLHKKSYLMALCEELATPVTQDGEFLLKGGFGSFEGISISPRQSNGDCMNDPCTNPHGCTNTICTNGACTNSDMHGKTCSNQTCYNTTKKPGSSEEPTKADGKIVQCGFLF